MALGKEVKFIDSFSAETSVVPRVVDRLMADLKDAGCPPEESDEIVIAMDEAITNAVQESIKTGNESPGRRGNGDTRNIVISYTIADDKFDAAIIDHGRGLDLFKILGMVPDAASGSYGDEIVSYATESEKSKIIVRINGMKIPLRGIGAGLKIILRFMDAISIDLIDKEKIIASSVSEYTDGTIFKMERKRRYH